MLRLPDPLMKEAVMTTETRTPAPSAPTPRVTLSLVGRRLVNRSTARPIAARWTGITR